ncbi:hypothetical protein M5K25_019969 [Dendrobium thyrsiflorum]|uniref:Uncharacterized protein n=1 Tax=Dendrobium thyrsiflorum TaxID=117978 RepID=A0ABD0UG17_DENTH
MQMNLQRLAGNNTEAHSNIMEAESHPPQPAINCHRLLSNCIRHPDEQVTGFCASCLRERLAGLENANARRHSTSSASSSAAFKTNFFRPAIGVNGRPSSSSQRQNGRNKNSAASSLRPELRRCKSFAGGPRAAAVVEPQRKSCDVRVRSTLSSLFHQEDRDRIVQGGQKILLSSSTAAANVLAAGEIEVDADSVLILETSKCETEDVRPMKDHIDLDSYSQTKKIPSRDIKEIAGSFWLAASIFSKKLQKWRRKHKPGKSAAGEIGRSKPSILQTEGEKIRISSRRFRDTQSEIAVDAFGRRSCDIAPRFSLDAGRISFDEQRCSVDGPRASWDGCLVNSDRSLPSRLPAKLAVFEDSVRRTDGLIPVEEDSKTPGCSEQTRDYYSDCSSRRRRSLDRSSSSRRHSVVLCDSKPAFNANIPELFHWSKLERESKIWGSNSLRENCSGSFDSTFRDPIDIHPMKKSRLWSIWGFIHRRDGSRAGGSQVIERSFSETWPELRATDSIQRSSSSVSARRSFSTNGGLTSALKSGLETTVQKKKKKKKNKSKDFVLDKSRSARYSPNHFDHGLLRFYLTPTRGSWRSGILTKSKFSSPRSFTNSLLRLY